MKKEKNRSLILVAIFIALLMALSAVGFIWSGGDSKERYKYGDYSFYYSEGKWRTQAENRKLSFDYRPEQLVNITMPSEAEELIKNARMIYISYREKNDSQEMALAQYELGRSLEKENRFVINALAAENNNDLPVISCRNATPSAPVIMLEENADTNSIILNNSCMILKGSPNLLGERVVYSVYGII